MPTKRIMLSRVHLSGTERRYIDEAFADDWVVPLGPHVDQFEHRLEKFLKVDNVVALSSGTAAIHLALVLLDVGRGDEVICQSMTFAASCNPIVYQGATPVFVDSEESTMNIDPNCLEQAIEERHRATGKYPKAIIPVDLYGMPARMREISELAQRYNIPIIEDAAEALGSEYGGKNCGSFGEFSALSFNGNKIITTSGGGALVCKDSTTAELVKFYATQARENRPYYFHERIGYNYRLSNISAAIGCGQMDVLEQRIARRKAINQLYFEALEPYTQFRVQRNPSPLFNSNFWLSTISISEDAGFSAEELRQHLAEDNIEARLLWRPMHIQPVFASAPYYGGGVAEKLFDHGLCLPSGSSLDDEDIYRVIDRIVTFAKKH